MRKYLLPTGVILAGLGLYAYAQQTTTPSMTAMICAYNASRLTIPDGQFGFVQCDAEGRIITAP